MKTNCISFTVVVFVIHAPPYAADMFHNIEMDWQFNILEIASIFMKVVEEPI